MENEDKQNLLNRIRDRVSDIIDTCKFETWLQNEDGSEYEEEALDEVRAVDKIMEVFEDLLDGRIN